MVTVRALIFGLLIGSAVVSGQRAPHKWWNDIKAYKTNSNSAEIVPSDDQLLTEASRLSSNLVRVPAPAAIAEKRVQFDDQPFDSIGSESQFMRRSTVFEDSNSNRGDSRDRIWSYFDSKLNNKRDNSQSNLPETTGSLFSSFHRKNPSPSSQNSRSSSTDDFFARHFKRATEQSPKPNSPAPTKSTSKTSEKDRVLALDFGQTRRKNPEEKERWNQLIKSIFDSSPRSSGASPQYGSGGNDYDFKSMTKTKIVEPNDIDDGAITEKSMRFEPNEDVLKDEPEENIEMKDMQLGGGSDEDKQSGSAKAATTVSPLMMQENVDEESGETAAEGEADAEEDSENETGARKRHATEAPTPMEQEEEDDEASNTVDHDEDNQYLRPQNKSKLARPPPTTAATTPATVNLNTKTPTRRQPVSTPSAESFGSRIHRSNVTSAKKPSFTMHFEMGAAAKKKITDLKKDPMFHPVDPTTPTTTPRASTEVFDGVSREMMEEMDNAIETTTSLPVTTTLRPFKGSRKSASGKWMDSETFKLNEDRSMIVDPEEDDEEDEPVTVSSVNKRPSRMSSPGLTTRAPQVIQKRKLQTQSRRKAVMANFRPTRQNSEFLDEESGDELSRLSKALPGTPGQDYPILGLIPRTSFDCAQHEWPGYYADVDTQCQVFHICQSGGRRDSFLCPNGTMFNQQLFICDWWHNVKCQEVPMHYGLNEKIYDYNWESKRMPSKAQSTKPRLAKRMGVAEALPTTTAAPITTVMIPSSKPSQSTSTNADQVWRRAQHLQGTKGRSRFGRQAGNERNAIKAFFERYKYAQSSTTTTEAPLTTVPVTTIKPVVKQIAASGSAPSPDLHHPD